MYYLSREYIYLFTYVCTPRGQLTTTDKPLLEGIRIRFPSWTISSPLSKMAGVRVMRFASWYSLFIYGHWPVRFHLTDPQTRVRIRTRIRRRELSVLLHSDSMDHKSEVLWEHWVGKVLSTKHIILAHFFSTARIPNSVSQSREQK